MGEQKGLTLVELLCVSAVAVSLLAVATMYSIPSISREAMRGAVNDIGAFMQLAKIEAVRRNQDCRFVVDTASGALEVWDSRGTPAHDDDSLLHRGRLADAVDFQRPDSGAAVTLSAIGGSSYETVFSSDGVVVAGGGEIHLFGGDRFGRVAVHAAGGTEISYWNGNAWRTGA